MQKNIPMLLKKPIAVALFLNIPFLALYLVLSSCKFASLDDFFMSSILTGAYGAEFDPHLFFVNAAYAYFLRPFYWLFPSVGWYYIFEVAEVFVSFTVFSYLLIKKLDVKWGVAASLILLACAAPNFYYNVSFTQNAALLTASGITLISLGSFDRRKLYLILGAVLLIAGFVMRKDGFLLGMPYIAALLFFRFILSKKIPIASITTFLISFVLIAGLISFDKSLYASPEYKYYAEYQGPRSVFGDGAYYDVEGVKDELEERGSSNSDFILLREWMFNDSEVFHLNNLRSMIQIVNRHLFDLYIPKLPHAILQQFSYAFRNPAAWCWALLSLVLVFYSKSLARYFPWVSLALVGVSTSYLLLVNRVVDHVVTGIWIYAIATTIFFFNKNEITLELKSNTIKILGGFALTMIYILSFLNLSDFKKASFFHTEISQNELTALQLKKYASEHPNDVFLLEFAQYKILGENYCSALKSVPQGSWNHFIPLGYWNVNLPQMKQVLLHKGIENPLRDIVKPNVYLVQSNKKSTYKSYYAFHYGIDLDMTTVESFDDFDIVKYRMREYEK